VSDDERIDLGGLDPERDAARLERSGRAIASRVAPALRARRSMQVDPWALLADWRRPVLAAAAVLVAISALAISRVPRTAAGSATVRVATATAAAANTSLLEAAGLPGAVASYVEAGTPPSPSKTLDLKWTP
jgi:hypothetical protein